MGSTFLRPRLSSSRKSVGKSVGRVSTPLRRRSDSLDARPTPGKKLPPSTRVPRRQLEVSPEKKNSARDTRPPVPVFEDVTVETSIAQTAKASPLKVLPACPTSPLAPLVEASSAEMTSLRRQVVIEVPSSPSDAQSPRPSSCVLE